MLIINGNQFGYYDAHYYYCKYLKEKFEIHYICFDRGLKKLQLDKVNVTYILFKQSKPKRIIDLIHTGIKQSWKIKPDVLFVVFSSVAFLLSLFSRAKLKVLDVQTGSLSDNPFRRKFENALLYLQSSFFRKVVILSESLRQKLHISIKKSLIQPLGSEIFFKGSHTYDNINLLYVGTLNKRRIDDTVDGLAIFLKRNPHFGRNISYTIIGYGTENDEKKLRDKIKNNKLETIVSFIGKKNHEELSHFFKLCNIGIAYVPIKEYYQYQPVTKIFEYGLSGLFTIATNTYENKRTVQKINGVLCDDNAQSFADALEFCHLNRLKLNSNAIRASFLEHEWENLVLSKLYPFIN